MSGGGGRKGWGRIGEEGGGGGESGCAEGLESVGGEVGERDGRGGREVGERV